MIKQQRTQLPVSCSQLLSLWQVLLNEIGMDENFITPLREKYLRPITALLYPDLGGACLDSHKAFVVKYALHEDLDLSSHYDNAEVTLNVSLGKDFTEGGLYFGDFRQVLGTFLTWSLLLFPLNPNSKASTVLNSSYSLLTVQSTLSLPLFFKVVVIQEPFLLQTRSQCSS